MSVEIVGYENVPLELRAGLTAFLAPYGATVVERHEQEVSLDGLVLATKLDLMGYNYQRDPDDRFPKTLVGRSWDTTLDRWARLHQHDGRPLEDLPMHERTWVKEARSVNGFAHLFVDYGHMDVNVLDRCLNDGMTTRLRRLGPKTHDFLRAFTDWRLGQLIDFTAVEA